MSEDPAGVAGTPEQPDQFDALLKLEDDWDTYGAPALDQATVERARQFMARVHATPMSGRGLQLEWHTDGIDLEIEFEPDGRTTVWAQAANLKEGEAHLLDLMMEHGRREQAEAEAVKLRADLEAERAAKEVAIMERDSAHEELDNLRIPRATEHGEIYTLRGRVAALQAQLDAFAEIDGWVGYCPLCGRHSTQGHNEVCRLQALIGEATQPPGDPPAIPQYDLPEDAARVLRENAWDLYDGVPTDPPVDPSVKHPNPCGVCGTFLWDDPRPCWNCKRLADPPVDPHATEVQPGLYISTKASTSVFAPARRSQATVDRQGPAPSYFGVRSTGTVAYDNVVKGGSVGAPPALAALVTRWEAEAGKRSVHGNPLKWAEADGIREVLVQLRALLEAK